MVPKRPRGKRGGKKNKKKTAVNDTGKRPQSVFHSKQVGDSKFPGKEINSKKRKGENSARQHTPKKAKHDVGSEKQGVGDNIRSLS